MMKKQVFNPYLPSFEYIPDGEPYVCWSAPVNDLSNWKYEGVIYRRCTIQ